MALAEGQGGHVNRAQLLAHGFTGRQIKHLIATGFLIRVHRNVYAVGRRSTSPLDLCHAALLAIGERCAIAGLTAASVWGVRRRWTYPLELITPLNRRPSGLIVHQSSALVERDIGVERGVRVIQPWLTILHLAPSVTNRQLERAIDDLRLRTYLSLEHLHSTVARFPRHPGARRLREVLRIANRNPTRSGWEQDWRLFAQEYDLPAYAINAMVAGHLADVLFLPDRLIVELDWLHDAPWQIERDKDRDAEIVAELGIPTIRITRDQFVDERAKQARRILKALERR